MRIDFKDFVPEDQTRFLSLSLGRKYEAPREVLSRANDWIEESGVKVIHVETLLLPGVPKKGEAASTQTELDIGMVSVSQWSQIIRVWFREGEA